MLKQAYQDGFDAALEKLGFPVPRAPKMPRLKGLPPGGSRPLESNMWTQKSETFKPLKAPNPATAPDSTVKNVTQATNYRPGSL